MTIETTKTQEKLDIVKHYYTPFHFDPSAEEENELYIQKLIHHLLQLQYHIKINKLNLEDLKDLFESIIVDEFGFTLLLVITTISFEDIMKIMDVICSCTDEKVSKMTNKDLWYNIKYSETAFSKPQIIKLLKNSYFRNCIMNMIYGARSDPFFIAKLPSFRLNKFDPKKLEEFPLIPESALDSLIRVALLGSYSAKKKHNAERILGERLKLAKIPYQTGALEGVNNPTGRTMDFCIPDKKNPVVIIESSVVTTTGSSQGDKAKAEIGMTKNIKEAYPSAKFYGMIDGIGWIRRIKDLERLVQAFDDVFTMNPVQIDRLVNNLVEMGLVNDE